MKRTPVLIFAVLINITTLLECCISKETQAGKKDNIIAMGKDSLVIGYDEYEVKNRKLINRSNENAVVLSFFEEFNDTIILYINGVEAWKNFIQKKDSTNASSGYSGTDVAVDVEKENEVIKLLLLKQNRFIEFPINKKYPLCTIQRYNNIWYLNYTRYLMILK